MILRLRVRTGSDSILLNQDWTQTEKFHSPLISAQRWARIRTGSDWIRTEANFDRIRTGSDCIFLHGGSGLDRTEKICCFNVIILFYHIKNVSGNVILQIG